MQGNMVTSNRNEIRDGDCNEHEWVVFSTAINDGVLMLQCVDCGKNAIVSDPTLEEWSEAFTAPTQPYRWRDQGRVRVQGTQNSLYVLRRDDGTYERVPREVIRGLPQITVGEAEELLGVAEMIRDDQFDGQLFSMFVGGLKCDGFDPCGALVALAQRIGKWSEKGMTIPPEWVLSALRVYATEGVSGHVL